ncbi:serpin family protein [Actinocorallia longicatena]|uniref:Serpin domain-containing protein n=1 Tax=Actinocorallia longicatena TaxID=111803 RepID=A0ABP6Q1A5_9ACTN
MSPAVTAANAMTRFWAERFDEESTVCSGAGAWPLLALLAWASGGPARTELEDALGVPAREAAGHARELLAVLAASTDAEAALGLWTHRALELKSTWLAALPGGCAETLTGDSAADQERLDRWARERTGGLIERMPVSVDAETLLVLASALTVRTRWRVPFSEWTARPGEGPWAHREVPTLGRRGAPADDLSVRSTPAGTITDVRVTGQEDVDVHLFLGAESLRAHRVLPAALAALAGGAPAPLADGPGVTVSERRSHTPEDVLDVTVPKFAVAAEHDLLALPGVFGLATATDASRGHFPGVCERPPLAIQQAKQRAVARFDALGFEAAAVTAFAARAGSAYRPPPHLVKEYAVAFERPFGFAAVHRPSGLVLFAGWVTDPDG